MFIQDIPLFPNESSLYSTLFITNCLLDCRFICTSVPLFLSLYSQVLGFDISFEFSTAFLLLLIGSLGSCGLSLIFWTFCCPCLWYFAYKFFFLLSRVLDVNSYYKLSSLLRVLLLLIVELSIRSLCIIARYLTVLLTMRPLRPKLLDRLPQFVVIAQVSLKGLGGSVSWVRLPLSQYTESFHGMVTCLLFSLRELRNVSTSLSMRSSIRQELFPSCETSF
jgi:hypothetical protein